MKALLHKLVTAEDGSLPLYVQITDAIRHLIQTGKLKAGKKLTPSRSFAVELGVSRTTVTTAYEQLKAEGFIQGHTGSGFYVSPIGAVEIGLQNTKSASTPPPAYEPVIAHHPSTADMRLFPYRQWARSVSKVARLYPKALLDQPDALGDIQLRKEIASYLEQWRGLTVRPEQILMTAGSIDALEICTRALLQKNETIGLEDPGYLPFRRFIKQQHIKPVWLKVDEHGASVPKHGSKKKPPKLVVITPSHQFPLGGAMPPQRRIEFINWAKKSKGWIIEDDYDSEFRYAGRPIPALSSMGDETRSIYIGSFAKIFSTGLRLGFLVFPEPLRKLFTQTVSFYGSKASVSSQRALALFMQSGDFYRHLRRARRTYAERRNILIELLSEDLHEMVEFKDFQAGMQLVVNFKENINDVNIMQLAQQQGVIVDALSSHYTNRPDKNGLILGFCAYNEDELRNNIRILKNIIRKQN